jgi:enoyl-CoA hydratase/carnithine racemase/predicted thioesterase
MSQHRKDFMRSGLRPGHSAELVWDVTAERSIGLGGGRVPVFSTPSMIMLMELAARAALAPFLEPGEESVGMDVSIQHLGATPVGSAVRGIARVTAVDGKQISFDVEAHDAHEPIGRGTHKRGVIQVERFAQKLQSKGGIAVGTRLVAPPELKPLAGDLPTFETLRVEVKQKIAYVTLNRPKQRNAINQAMSRELDTLLNWLAGHPSEARVVILTGDGPAFCAGNDLKQISGDPIDKKEEWNIEEARLSLALQEIPQPVIAAINGPCFGGGLMLTVACDFRIAARSATFGLPEAKLGWPPSFLIGALASIVGKANAIDLCLRGETFDAERARVIGLVSEVTAPIMLLRTAEKIARDLLALPPEALRATRRLLQQISPGSTPWTETITHDAYMKCLATPDATEGLSAFIEKRPPKFST